MTSHRACLAAATVAAVLLACLLLLLLPAAEAVDRSKFKTCKDAAFCRRHRRRTEYPNQFAVQEHTLAVGDSAVTATLTGGDAGAPPFALDMRFYATGTARVRVTEKTSQRPRYESPDVLLEETFVPATVTTATVAPSAAVAASGSAMYITYAAQTGITVTVVVEYSPFSVKQYADETLVTSVNSRGLFHFEHRRNREGQAHGAPDAAAAAEAAAEAAPEKTIVDWGEDGKPIYDDGSIGGDPETAVVQNDDADTDGMWEESFSTHRDSKPHGPTSVSLDISFHGMHHVYGIPEHASSLSLKPTDGKSGSYSEPYRMYNLDVFEYELDEPMALYGSIPFMTGHNEKNTAGVFWHNPSEMFIDVIKNPESTDTHWIAESGIVDLMLMPGPKPKQVVAQYAALTGAQALPPLFALAYHQCRWNYKDEADVANVDAQFEKHNFPYDVLWLDIEHTDGKRYMTWDHAAFPNPIAMQNKLAERGRKMVTIIDPHIKRDGNYKVHSQAESKGYYIKNKDGGDYSGWCWPGDSSYLDFTAEPVRNWWADMMSLENYPGSTKNLFVWNDMNEPSVFNGPEVSMNKDAKNLDDYEHRDWHNMYGFYHQWATAEGIRRRNNARPFVLTRSVYAGSQRHGAIWTGDNAAKWDHLAVSAPMIMSLGVAGLPFAGADVGGFFGNPDTELLTRWYQAGAFQPFMRAHAHIDTARREPWLFGDEVLANIKTAVVRRYTYLPYLYTLFFQAFETGAPVMRPLWMEFPSDTHTFAMDDQWLLGSDLLIKPVTSAGQISVDVYFPGDGLWYDADLGTVYRGGSTSTVAAPLHTMPIFQRGGSIISRKLRLRRCSKLMQNDPYTLDIALAADHTAYGELYVDDEETFDFLEKHYVQRAFTFKNNELVSERIAGTLSPTNVVERLVITGLGAQPAQVASVSAAGHTTSLHFKYDAAADRLVVRKPWMSIAEDWKIEFTM